ncbi:uncharacterized protein LOC128806149 [Vidua macroura]|uniref:uncharacterized protein LOC128806149 n=1 Tax=Vidua macroura TaxID=187451 RepID=UPI0023A7BEF6|nr:uncharacterized protein LOC128806149 [Vidua macroura]
MKSSLWINMTSVTHFLMCFCYASLEFLSLKEPGEQSVTVWPMSCLWNSCSLHTCISTENSLGTSALMELQTTHLAKGNVIKNCQPSVQSSYLVLLHLASVIETHHQRRSSFAGFTCKEQLAPGYMNKSLKNIERKTELAQWMEKMGFTVTELTEHRFPNFPPAPQTQVCILACDASSFITSALDGTSHPQHRPSDVSVSVAPITFLPV